MTTPIQATSHLFTQINDSTKAAEALIASKANVIASTLPQDRTEPVAQSEEDKKLAETFQRISKQETHLKSERAKIDEARKTFEAEKSKAEKYTSLEGKSPFEILEHFGITYDKLLEADKARNNPVDPKVQSALDRVNQLESKIISKEEEVTKERRSRAEIQIRSDVAKTIKENDFDILEIMGADQAVIDYMEEIYSQTGEISDYKEACEAVIENLTEQYHKLSKSRFVQIKEEPIKESIQKPTATLTQKHTQSTVSKDKPMTETDRFNAALAALSSVNHRQMK